MEDAGGQTVQGLRKLLDKIHKHHTLTIQMYSEDDQEPEIKEMLEKVRGVLDGKLASVGSSGM